MLTDSEKIQPVNLHDLEEVKMRTMLYLKACQKSAVFPTLQGLSAYGFKYSRQNVTRFLSHHPETPTAQYIELFKDVCADVLINSSLNHTADTVMAIFVLKNNHGFSDKLEVDTPVHDPLGELQTPEEIAKKYSYLPSYDEIED